MRVVPFALFILLLLTSCDDGKKKSLNHENAVKASKSLESSEMDNRPPPPPPVELSGQLADIENAHKAVEFRQNELVSYNLDLEFGGQKRFEGVVTMSPSMDRIQLKPVSGPVLQWDNEQLTKSQDSVTGGDRFAIFTWPYFFDLPYKLTDQGANYKELPDVVMGADQYKAGELTFDAGVGDAPDDWYHVFSKNGLIQGAGYIVTYGGQDAEEAAENAHAIRYADYKMVDGIPVAHSWTFHDYKNGQILEPVIGKATLSNVRIKNVTDSMFVAN